MSWSRNWLSWERSILGKKYLSKEYRIILDVAITSIVKKAKKRATIEPIKMETTVGWVQLQVSQVRKSAEPYRSRLAG